MKIIINKDKKLNEKASSIRDKYLIQLNELVKTYSQTERETWFSQLREADAWLADNTVATPMLSAMAQSRGISLELLIAKIKEKDIAYRIDVGVLLGQQQAELDQLYNK